MEDKYKLYDQVVSTTLVNLMIENNRNYGIALSPFNPTDINHLYIFEVALLLSNSIHKTFYVEMKLFNYWKFKIHNWSVRKSFKRYTDRVSIIPLELDKILEFMKDEMSLENDIYQTIYEEYYKAGNENRSIYRRKRKE